MSFAEAYSQTTTLPIAEDTKSKEDPEKVLARDQMLGDHLDWLEHPHTQFILGKFKEQRRKALLDAEQANSNNREAAVNMFLTQSRTINEIILYATSNRPVDETFK